MFYSVIQNCIYIVFFSTGIGHSQKQNVSYSGWADISEYKLMKHHLSKKNSDRF